MKWAVQSVVLVGLEVVMGQYLGQEEVVFDLLNSHTLVLLVPAKAWKIFYVSSMSHICPKHTIQENNTQVFFKIYDFNITYICLIIVY